MVNALLITIGKLLSIISRSLNLGSGSTWPGHIALSVNKNFIKDLLTTNPNLRTILIAGTNGKTTTGKLIQTVLEKTNHKIFQNESGANLLNGIASTLIHYSNGAGKINHDYGIFEIDENTLPLILKEISNPDFIIILNLFRDQLDRYGEVNTIIVKWRSALSKLSSKTKLILNADDPQVAFLGSPLPQGGVPVPPLRWKPNAVFFGLNDKNFATSKNQHAADSTFCPNCGTKLVYKIVYFSHLGDWFCKNCGLKRPKLNAQNAPSYPLVGIYNRYNTIAAILLFKQLKISEKEVNSALQNFKPAFGRQEILNVNGKKVQIFLSKNPTSFNESLRTVADLGGKNLLIVLNDRIPDGRDVSWIWDVDMEEFLDNYKNIVASGDRCYDMILRIKYANSSKFPISNFQFPINSQNSNSKFQIVEDLKEAVALALQKTPKSETLYILPTYSAMLEVRKILTGKKIL